MSRSSKNKMPLILIWLCVTLVVVILFYIFSLISGVFALLGAGEDGDLIGFSVSQLTAGLLIVVPLLLFVGLVRSVVVAKEFFSRRQSRRMLLISICLISRVAVDLLAPSIEVPAMFSGAIGSMTIGPSLDLTLLAVSLMFFAMAGVFEYGRKLQEDSDSIL